MAPAPPIHVISLARTPDRLAGFRADNPGLKDWRVFPAVDGTTVDASTRDALGDTALWSPGGVGAALSHMALWRLCVSCAAPLTVCEDDAVLRSDFAESSAVLLGAVPDFDVVLWGWNFDAVMEAELATGVPVAMLADQAALRGAVEAFRQDRGSPLLLKLRKALGMPCYTLSPKGAAELLARATPVGPVRLALPLMPYEIGNVTFDVTIASLYEQLSAHVAFPPLAVTRNDWARSTIRLPRAREPAAALAGAAAQQASGRLGEAVALLQAAAVATPKAAALWSRLGLLLAEQGHLAAAAAALQRALSLDLAKEGALYNLARVRLLQGAAQAALDLLDQAVALAPDFALAHCNRGVALLALERAAEAEPAFRAAAELSPTLLEAQRGLAAARLGRADLAGAADAQQAAVLLAPDDAALAGILADLHLQLAARALAQDDLEGAARFAGRAAEAPGRRQEALVVASDALERLGRFQESWDTARQAVGLDAASPHAQNNLGVACLRLNRPAEAEQAYRAAIAIAPQYADAHHGLAFALLKQGRWAEGWLEYDWRLRTPQAQAWTRSFARPLWTGDVQPTAILLLAAEQGLGDTLQAACLIAAARERVGSVVVQAPAALLRLLRRMPGVDAVEADSAPQPPHDLWLPLMSLPGRMGVTPDRRPPAAPALAADPALAAAWRARLPSGAVRIGVVWQGNPTARVEHGRSFPLAALAPLALLPGVALVSLQKGFGCEQLVETPPGLSGVTDLGEPYQLGDFDDTAAILASLDLVVCCDTATAHLAGALGRPVWIALGDNPDWRWPADRRDTPWYASARLFRRRPHETWRQLFTRLAGEINVLKADQMFASKIADAD